MPSRIAAVALLLTFTLAGETFALDPSGRDLNEERPCGPAYLKGPIRYLFPQGVAGADFKPACRCHDRCYETPTTQADCDERFRRNLECACESSRSKILCRFVARIMHASVRAFGAASKSP